MIISYFAAKALTHHALDRETLPPGIFWKTDLGLLPFSMIIHRAPFLPDCRSYSIGLCQSIKYRGHGNSGNTQ